MRKNRSFYRRAQFVAFAMTLFLLSGNLSSQDFRFSIWTDPMITWLSSDTRESENNGLRPGLGFGLSFDKFFADNYAFSTGIFLVNAGGNMVYSDTTVIRLRSGDTSLPANKNITYRLQYLSVPLGLKLVTNQIGYITFFTNIGLDPKVLIGSKCDISDLDIEGENVSEEVKLLNLGYHINAGIEYSLGGSTALAFGLGYENNFLDATHDFEDQAEDLIRMHFLRFKIGIIF